MNNLKTHFRVENAFFYFKKKLKHKAIILVKTG